jgi:hypothetical protein
LDVVLVIVNTSKVRVKYPLNDYHSNNTSYVRSKHENTSDGTGNLFQNTTFAATRMRHRRIHTIAMRGRGRSSISALAIREKALGRGHPDTATSLNNLARVIQAQGDLAGARPSDSQ